MGNMVDNTRMVNGDRRLDGPKINPKLLGPKAKADIDGKAAPTAASTSDDCLKREQAVA